MSALLLLLLLGNLPLHLAAQDPVFLAPPADVHFDSVDYRTSLRWTASSSTTPQYHVQWKIYGEPQWLDVSECQGIQEPHCDLSSVTSDTREWYYARVHASSPPSSQSAWTLSPRFSPRWETKISPPALRLNVTEQGIVVRLKSRKSLVQKMLKKLCYKIYLTHTTGEEELLEIDCCSKQLVLRELKARTRYCLQAQTVIPLQGKSSERSRPKCATTR